MVPFWSFFANLQKGTFLVKLNDYIENILNESFILEYVEYLKYISFTRQILSYCGQ